MLTLKSAARRALRVFASGRRDGLSLFGLWLERLSRYGSFLTRELREQARFSKPAPKVSSVAKSRPPANALVFDVGANNGDDTEFYLKKGFRVVAIEANPELARGLENRYKNEISERRVEVLNIALVEDDVETVAFFSNRENDKVSTIVKPVEEKDKFVEIQIPAARLPSLIEKYGVPYYLKIDIEGADVSVLKSLLTTDYRPEYISVEAHTMLVLHFLLLAGYSKYKIVEGRYIHLPYFSGPYYDSEGRELLHLFSKGDTSGPFGDDLPGPWLDIDQAFEYLAVHGLGWKDIHAAR